LQSGESSVSACNCQAEKAAVLEAVRFTERLTNGDKPTTVLGHPEEWAAPKGLVASNPLEGELPRLEGRSWVGAASKHSRYRPRRALW